MPAIGDGQVHKCELHTGIYVEHTHSIAAAENEGVTTPVDGCVLVDGQGVGQSNGSIACKGDSSAAIRHRGAKIRFGAIRNDAARVQWQRPKQGREWEQQ